MVLLAHRRPDQYYWVTSLLSARHIEKAACTLIAAMTVAMGALPVASLFTPAGADTASGITISVLASMFCLVMAFMWARRRWPTRIQSKVFFVGTVVATSASVLQIQDPIAALLGTMVFVVLCFYVVFFHGTGYMAFNLAAALATTSVIAYRIDIRDGLVAAVCAAVFVLVILVSVPAICWSALRLLGIDVLNADVDLFTGLSTTQAFYRGVAELIGSRTRNADQFLVVTAIVLDDLALLSVTESTAARERAQVALAQALRDTTRSSALLAYVDTNLFVLAENFTTSQLDVYAQRIHGTLATTPPRMDTSIGIVHTPLNGLAILPPEPLLDNMIATAIEQARRNPTRTAQPSIAVFSPENCPRDDWPDIDDRPDV